MLSVIIPHFNRGDTLPQTLDSLAHQSIGGQGLEAILVDDGSTDGSVETVLALRSKLPYSLSLIRQQHSGPAAARNKGAGAARHELLLFWDSDMIADPRALETHLALHARQDHAVVAGAMRPWKPACQSIYTQVMDLSHGDEDQFATARRLGGRPSTFQEVLSSNVSLRRDDFSGLGGFDESLRAFEDIDLGYRAQQAGLHLLFSPEAIGYHNHTQTLESACARQRFYQKQCVRFLAKHPELQGQISYLVDKGPIEWRRDAPALAVRKLIRQIVASAAVRSSMRACVKLLERLYPDPRLLEYLYWKIVASYQLLGYREGLAELAASSGAGES